MTMDIAAYLLCQPEPPEQQYWHSANLYNLPSAPGPGLNWGGLGRPNRPLTAQERPTGPINFSMEFPYKSGHKLDFITATNGNLLVSRRVWDLIEAFEPGKHQIIPFRLLKAPELLRQEHPDMDFGLLNIVHTVDFIDIERSHLTDQAITKRLGPIYESQSNRPKLVTKPGWVAAGHLWTSIKSVMPSRLFISTELKTAFDAIGAGPIHWQPVARG